MVASHAMALPSNHGTKVMPSGRRRLSLKTPKGSFAIGNPAEDIERAMMSLTAKCLVWRAAACLHTYAWVPKHLPVGHICNHGLCKALTLNAVQPPPSRLRHLSGGHRLKLARPKTMPHCEE